MKFLWHIEAAGNSLHIVLVNFMPLLVSCQKKVDRKQGEKEMGRDIKQCFGEDAESVVQVLFWLGRFQLYKHV